MVDGGERRGMRGRVWRKSRATLARVETMTSRTNMMRGTVPKGDEGGAGSRWERIQLVPPSIEYQSIFLDLMREFIAEGNRRYVLMYPAARDDFPRYIRRLERAAKYTALQPGFIQETTYWLRRGEAYILGSCRLRHRLSRALTHEGGHIGYDIRPKERGKGYGTLQLRLVLEKAAGMGLRKVLVTCDTDNLASTRVIEKNGGVLENRVVSHVTRKKVNRYWIEI